MRKIVLVGPVLAIAVAGIAYAAVTNLYTVQAEVSPAVSGTPAHPKPVKVRLTWTVDTSPAGERPATVREYAISLAGIHEGTRYFSGCGTSTLLAKGPSGCPAGAWVGGGYLIIEAGPAGVNDSNYNGKCRVEVSIYDGGAHHLSLYVYEGSGHPGQPAPCPIQAHPAAIDVSLTNTAGGLLEKFSVPSALLHIFGTDSAVIQGALGIPAREKRVERRFGRRLVHRTVGLLASTACLPPNQRYVSFTFTREDGATDTRRLLLPCA